MAACPYDRKDSPASPVYLTHYLLVRSDLPGGVRFAATGHAAGESVRAPLPEGVRLVHLAVPNEHELRSFAELFIKLGIDHKLIVEDAGPHAGQAMAIGIVPIFDRTPVRKVCSHLPLST